MIMLRSKARTPFRHGPSPARAVPALLGLGALVLLAGPAASEAMAQEQEAVPVLERAAERYGAMESFCADFRQELRVTLLRRTVESRGELCQLRPDRFEMRFTEPEGDRIVADGTYIWIYFPSTDPGQAFRTRLAGAQERFDFHREFLSDPGERYRTTHEGTEEVEGRTAHRILLEPRAVSPYERVRVWVDARDHLVRRMEIHEESETIRILELTNLRLNPSLAADRFRFEVPEGVQVLSRDVLP